MVFSLESEISSISLSPQSTQYESSMLPDEHNTFLNRIRWTTAAKKTCYKNILGFDS